MDRIMNPNSLENLRKEKPRHHEYEKFYAIPQEKVDKLFLLLASDKTLNQAAIEAGISFDTAKKYFEKGDPRRAIEPLKKRLMVYQTKKSEKFTEEFIKRQKYLLAVVRRQIAVLRKGLEGSADSRKVSYPALEKMIKLELILMGKPERVEDTGLLTAEEIKLLSDKAEIDDGSSED